MFERKRGVSVVRNRGINEPDGEYIAFLAEDDVWFADHLERVYEHSSPTGQPCSVWGWLGRFGDAARLILPQADRLFEDYVRDTDSCHLVRGKKPLTRPFFMPSMATSAIEASRARGILFGEEIVGREDILFGWQLATTSDKASHCMSRFTVWPTNLTPAFSWYPSTEAPNTACRWI